MPQQARGSGLPTLSSPEPLPLYSPECGEGEFSDFTCRGVSEVRLEKDQKYGHMTDRHAVSLTSYLGAL